MIRRNCLRTIFCHQKYVPASKLLFLLRQIFSAHQNLNWWKVESYWYKLKKFQPGVSESIIFSSLLLVEISNNSVSACHSPQRGAGEVLLLLVICKYYLEVLTGLFLAASGQSKYTGLDIPEKGIY